MILVLDLQDIAVRVVTAGKTQGSDMAKNLIKNPCGEEKFTGWEIGENGGDGWNVEEAKTTYFASSFLRCTKSQLIDLHAEGYKQEVLDAQPKIVVTDWYAGRFDAPCEYDLHVELLSQSHQVLDHFHSGIIKINKAPNNFWNQISHTFSDYGKGVRYVRFTHGGKDTVFWKGWYGPHVTNSSVIVEA